MSQPTAKTKAALFCDGEAIDRVYGQGRRERVAALTELYPAVVRAADFDRHVDHLEHIEAIFSTWGMPRLTAEQIRRLPSLKAVFYAAGAVKDFAEPFLDSGMIVVSAWAANGVPVAEFTLAQILLSCKDYFRDSAACRRGPEGWRTMRPPGVFGETIALIGAGVIGRKVIELLKPFALDVVVVDPYLSDDATERLGVAKVSLEEAFSRAYVVSNHLPNLPALRGVLDGALFASMRQGATFINTGRGAQVNETDLVDVLTRRPDLTALLDVTHPEPPEAGSPLYELPNIHLSSHIAGSLGNEVVRMADTVIDEFIAWRNAEPLRYAVTAEMLTTMA